MQSQYLSFDPRTSTYSKHSTVDEAIAARDMAKQEYIAGFVALVGKTVVEDIVQHDLSVVVEFCTNGGFNDPIYVSSVLDVTTGIVIARVFSAVKNKQEYYIKVANSKVVELYQIGGVYQGVTYPVLALTLDGVNVVEYYSWDASGAAIGNKYDAATGKMMAQNYFCKFSDLPETMKTQLADFKYKNYVFLWSPKSNGPVIEFKEQYLVPYAECSDDERADIDKQKADIIAPFDDRILMETIDAHGTISWTAVDLPSQT